MSNTAATAGRTQEEPRVITRKDTTVRDLVTMGIFIALFLALMVTFGMLMAFLPIIMILLPLLMGILGGVIFSILLAKVQRPGSFLISSVILGLFLITMAPGAIMCYMTIIGGVLAEIIYWKFGRTSFNAMWISYAVYMVFFGLGVYVPFIWMKQAYLDLYADSEALEVARLGTEVIHPVLMIVLLIGTIFCCWLGFRWGKSLTKKQFAKAGIV
ncbi:MptD family putative ECF transporter S component [Corynebacterium cystitidis]|uniref:Energy-coupling factor transport system substrate-specific component n=1 Tax=Corynebacterium cystitidis DSM 20524 TaxID=1121357 RepID=A0A1H9RC58_9CORY|nr:MptD family putative ECF transporter S component [Corynebacterium cystitidis]WJY81485.1 hypothetical protein CCYS_02560 [Corynebacterium cystitidis DSM 20524]SER70270.1 energy-coupling factor transport system substrate-specific component [Corynebacterium cystitidis DSM 20524]SNV87044.1 ABC transporter permease [Corynebacterium cystitidis]